MTGDFARIRVALLLVRNELTDMRLQNELDEALAAVNRIQAKVAPEMPTDAHGSHAHGE